MLETTELTNVYTNKLSPNLSKCQYYTTYLPGSSKFPYTLKAFFHPLQRIFIPKKNNLFTICETLNVCFNDDNTRMSLTASKVCP